MKASQSKQSGHSKHLLRCLPRVVRRLAASPVIALFLDFDGTLAPLQLRPEDVWLDDATGGVLNRIARSPRFRVWIVSGRRRADVRQRVGVAGIRYLGLHGWEGRAAPAIPAETREAFSCARSWLSCLMLDVPGIRIEDKGVSMAIHYRTVTADGIRRARKYVHGVIAPFADQLQLIRGRRIWEIAPREIGDKGVAVRAEWRAAASDATPIYIGDDLMDEPAFVALKRGITVRVGPSARTSARYRVKSVAEVLHFLEALAEEFA